MRRHHIVLGDPTTAGGVVVSASSGYTIHGHRVACVGDTVDCRGCKSTGVITAVGARITHGVGGRGVALEGDVCACRCSGSPTLCATQNTSRHGASAGN